MIEIYCDESRQDLLTSQHPSAIYTLIGSLWINHENREELKNHIKDLRKQYNVWGEIKWSKVSSLKEEFYKRLIDLFFEYPKTFYFRCVCVDSRQVDNNLFNQGDGELGFYKFYYHVLYHWINDNPINCRVYCDIKPNRKKDRLKVLFRTLKNTSMGSVESIQALNSSENVMLQFCDYLLGLTSASLNKSVLPGSTKMNLIKYFEELKGSKIKPTPKNVKKFNVFCIKLRGNK
jgi:hypothetical protein